MKLSLSKRYALLLLCCINFFSSFSQNEIHTDFINRANFVFTNLEKNRVPHGLLLDYAMEFADLKNYNGILTDTNQVNAGILRDLYATIAMSAIHSNAGNFYGIDYRDSLWAVQRQAGIITLSGLYYNYARFKDDALTANRLTVSSDQFFDKYSSGVWQNPYQTETVFAMSPALHAYSGTDMQVVLPYNLWHTNNAAQVSSIAIDFDNGNGYQNITAGVVVNLNYADTGTKTWRFRLTLTDNSILYSHTLMQVMPDAAGDIGGSGRFLGDPVPLEADEAFNGVLGQGWVRVDYANPASLGPDGLVRLRLNRPLIVAEGFDPGNLLNPENQFGSNNIFGFREQIRLSGSELNNLLRGDLQQYDIVYVDWGNGTDFLQRNGLFLERVIEWVNDQKELDGSTQPNVVLGQSMGGVIARWALRDMENKNLPHDTRLYISYDAPHQGANVPLAYQHAARHANNLLMATAIPVLFPGNSTFNLVKKSLNLMDVPAARQMLYNRVLDNGNLSNGDHDAWQTALRNMGYPQQTRNIAISNGSECGIDQGFNPGATLLRINGKANTRFLTDLIGSTPLAYLGWIGASVITLKPQFLLGILPGRNEFLFDIYCKAQPNGSPLQIYKGNINYKKKVLWTVGINTTITSRSRMANTSLLAIDGTAGGLIDTEINLQDNNQINWAMRYNIDMASIPNFNFIPTTSALDIGGGNTSLNLFNYQDRYIGALPPAAPLNSPFANYTTAFSQTQLSSTNFSNNENHLQIGPRNGNWLAAELNRVNPTDPAPQTNCSNSCFNNAIAGPSPICNFGFYSLPGIPAGTAVTWSANPAGFVTIANPNDLEAEVSRNPGMTGTVTLTATLTAQAGCGAVVNPSRLIQVGLPLPSFGVEPLTSQGYCAGYGFEAIASTTVASPYTYNWYINGVLQSYHGYKLRATFPANITTVGLEVVKTGCGPSDRNNQTFYCSSGRIAVSPNPSRNLVMIISTDQSDFKKVRVLDKLGNIKKEINLAQNIRTYQLNVSDLAVDVYTVQVFTGQEWLSAKLSVQ